MLVSKSKEPAIGLQGFAQQRCKRARYDANELAREFNKLSMVHTCGKGSSFGKETQSVGCGLQNQRTNGSTSAHASRDDSPGGGEAELCNVPVLPKEKNVSLPQPLSLPSRQTFSPEETCDWSPTNTAKRSADGPISGDEFEEELNYLVSQVQMSDTGSSPAQAMPYIF